MQIRICAFVSFLKILFPSLRKGFGGGGTRTSDKGSNGAGRPGVILVEIVAVN